MESLWFFLIVGIVIAIIVKIHTSYEKKVQSVIDNFRAKTKKFYNIAEGFFDVKTNGLKVSRWDKEHKIDFVINNYGHQLIEELKNYDDLKIWWNESMPEVKSSVISFGEIQASQMFIFGGMFTRRIHNEINNLIQKYNPENIKFRLATYTYYTAGERHYDASIGKMSYQASSRVNTSFITEITPEELRERIQFLEKFDFRITKYQYECENQRALMTPQLREEIILRDRSICQICGKYCFPEDIEIDHIKPISKGGKTIESNLQVLCVSCNRSKSNKWEESFENFKQEHYEDQVAKTTDSKNVETKTNAYQPKNHFKYDKYGNIKIQNHINKPDVSDNDSIGVAVKSSNVKTTDLGKKWIKVESSNIIQTYYNKETRCLYVMFKNSDIYKYYDVEISVFIEFLGSASKGTFVNSDLNRYKYEKVKFVDVI